METTRSDREKRRAGDTISSDWTGDGRQRTVHLLISKSFPGFSAQQAPTSPRMVFFRGGCRSSEALGPERCRDRLVHGEERLCPALALRGGCWGEPVLLYGYRGLGTGVVAGSAGFQPAFLPSLCARLGGRREGEGSAGWKPALPAGECSTLASCRERRFLVKRAGQVRILREDADEEGVDSGALLVRHYSTVSQLMAMAGAAIRR
jgi:hypothetical protein